MDDAIREHHGVQCRDARDSSRSAVLIRETEQSIIVERSMHDQALTPWQARYLAAKLYRLSRRIRDRSTPTAVADKGEGAL